MTIAQYRLLLIVFLITGICGGLLDLVFPGLLPEPFHDAQRAHDDSLSSSRLTVFMVSALATVGLGIASTYGLFVLRPWAPRLALITTVLAVLIWPLSGPMAESGLAAALNYLSSYLWGAAVVLANVPPLKGLFQRRDG
jgi:hypothetical protein